ncbi:hypothetical protein Ahy_A01g000276 isoform E [Arachis hypogaea]|nr:hypothetical protein Ahy_A01g000276 isoform E [Arachis hypogaea]
MFCINP